MNGCYLTYFAAGNQLSLLSDDGNNSTSGQPGTTGTLSNSQCSVDLSATTVTASGNTLTIAPTITFKSGFKAGIQIYMYVARYSGTNTGWKTMGWWMVGSVPESAPSAVSVSPSSGFGTTQQFSFVASSPNGAGNLALVNMVFNTIGSPVNGCDLTYIAAGNQLSLLSDDGNSSTSGQPGATGTLSNSQCSVNLSATTVTASGNTLTVAPTITFKSGFAAGIQIYMYVARYSRHEHRLEEDGLVDGGHHCQRARQAQCRSVHPRGLGPLSRSALWPVRRMGPATWPS